MRGEAGVFPLDSATIEIVGASLARRLTEKLGRAPLVVIGRDTRESGEWLEQSLVRGLIKAGATSKSAAVITTPGVAFLARTLPADAGVVISASHNAYRDNGIKLVHVTRCRTPGRLAYHHFIRGRAWGRILAERGRDAGELSGYFNRRLTLIEDCVGRWGGLLADCYSQVKPLIRLGVASAWIGAHSALATHRQTLGNRPQADRAADIREASAGGSPSTSQEVAKIYHASEKRGEAP